MFGQLYGVPHGILRVINTILYGNEFQNPQNFHLHVRFSPERSTLDMSTRLKPCNRRSVLVAALKLYPLTMSKKKPDQKEISSAPTEQSGRQSFCYGRRASALGTMRCLCTI
jgi:hypothetical protein